MNIVHGWFSDNKEWIEFIAAAVVFWLVSITAILSVVRVFEIASSAN